MIARAHPAFLFLFVVIVAPVGAVVVVAALLLFGMHPRSVFAPGWAVKSLLESLGIHAPNAVGVATTVGLWWLLFVAAGLVWEWRRARSAE
jgi:hypothetical protein